MGVDFLHFKGHISSMAQIVDALGQVLSAIEHLILDHKEDGRFSEEDFEVEVDRSDWHKLLRPFSNVKYLRVDDGLVEEFSRYLRLDNGELPPELLPELQELTYSGGSNAGDAFTSFIDARQNAGHPVSLVPRSLTPPSYSRRLEAVRLFLRNIQHSKEHGDEWLSVDEVDVICVFEGDEMAAESYITVASMSDESLAREWVRGQLVQKGAICDLMQICILP